MSVYASAATLEAKIEHLRLCGSSLIMNFGEDTAVWEVAWITSGVRFCGFSKDLASALDEAEAKAVAAFRG